ncbi:MAG: BACON domain-containing protein, partial [Micrococcales bacterium]|nr:BACON domain-containing protein [Micrococcales bacterium]
MASTARDHRFLLTVSAAAFSLMIGGSLPATGTRDGTHASVTIPRTQLVSPAADEDANMWLSQTAWAPSADAESIQVTALTNYWEWNAASNRDWLTVQPVIGVTGSTMTVSVAPNPGGVSRTGTVTVTAGLASAALVVSQGATQAKVALSRTWWMPGAGADSAGVNVTTNQPTWTADSDQPWLLAVPALERNALTIAVTQNPGPAPRHGTITVRAGEASAAINVTQADASASVATHGNSVWFQARESSVLTWVTTNQLVWTAVADVPWLTPSPSIGTTGAGLYINAEANTSPGAREGAVTLTAGGVTARYTVRQFGTGDAVVLSQTAWRTSALASSAVMNVQTSGLTWAASSSQPWLSTTTPSGGNEDVLWVFVEENVSITPRSATLTVTAGTARATLEVTQAGMGGFLWVSRTVLAPASAGESAEVSVETSHPTWSASADVEWISLSPASGASGSTPMTVAATAHAGVEPRLGLVTITAAGETKTLEVRQFGSRPDIVVSEPSLHFGPAAGTGSVTVWTNQPTWSAATLGSWLTITPPSGISGGTMTVLATANTTGSARGDYVKVSAGEVEVMLMATQTVEAGPSTPPPTPTGGSTQTSGPPSSARPGPSSSVSTPGLPSSPSPPNQPNQVKVAGVAMPLAKATMKVKTTMRAKALVYPTGKVTWS